jgi:hypothetical protein
MGGDAVRGNGLREGPGLAENAAENLTETAAENVTENATWVAYVLRLAWQRG